MASIWEIVSAASGVIYFASWSASFYPQLFLNHRRKTTLGLSPDYIVVNPIGFLCLSIWSFGAFFSPTVRRQYAERHNGHYPQVSRSDLAFSLHALVLSLATLVQSVWYFYRARQERLKPEPAAAAAGERSPLLSGGVSTGPDLSRAPTRPSAPTRLALAVLAVATLWELTSLALGRTELLDVLYFASSVKLVITIFKYLPQVFLNYKLKSVRGFAISTIFYDLTGSIFSFLQLVVSAVFIDGAPSGIWANPGKLGLALLTFVFDFTFIWQRYVLYPETPANEDVDDDF